MKKNWVAFLILAILIPGLFIAAKITFAPKQDRRPISQTGRITDEQNPSGSKPAKVSPEYKPITGSQLLPVDEAAKNDSFKVFRDQLTNAVTNKDVKFLKQHVDENIKYSFGENSGMAGFLQEWKLDRDPAHSEFWAEIEKVIQLGGSFDSRNSFVAPYVFSRFPDSVDAFVYVAVVDKNVKLYGRPDEKSEVLGILNYNIVQSLEFQKAQPWQKISAGNNVVGYVQTKYLRSPVDYRAYFANKGGVWKMVFFVAGD